MSAVGRFLAGLLIGIAVPVGVTLAWTKLSGSDPVIVFHGEVSEEQETILKSRIEHLMEESESRVSAMEIESDIERIGWIDDTEVWRTLTNRLHIEISRQLGENETRDSEELNLSLDTGNSANGEESTVRVSESMLDSIGNRAREHGDVLENAVRTSEGLKIVLESGTSVLLGNQDLEERMDRFLAVYRKLEGQADLSRLVADARYDQGVAVEVLDEEDDSSFSNDEEIATGPLVITHE